MPKISIIIPSYNAAEYLPQSLNCCISQSFKDFEIILVNDGSTDETIRVVNEIRFKNPLINIVLLTKSNGGLVSARKYGVKYAKGQYLFFLDADDKISSDALMILNEHCDENDIVVGDFVLENSKGDLLPIQHKNVMSKDVGNIYVDYLTKSVSASLCGRLIKKELLDDFSTPEDMTIGEDFITNMIVARNFPNLRVYIVNEPIYHYVLYKNSMLNTVSNFALSQRIKYINWVTDFFCIESDKNNKALNEALSYFVLEEYYSFLRDGGSPSFDKKLYSAVFSKYWNKNSLTLLRGWRKILLVLYKYSPFCGNIFRCIITKSRSFIKK